ncbi:MAG: hypothetical protein Q8R98_06240, partial [Rubrivivax sp.]|nr:hypothetical protein [Rubrivivax sp.]
KSCVGSSPPSLRIRTPARRRFHGGQDTLAQAIGPRRVALALGWNAFRTLRGTWSFTGVGVLHRTDGAFCEGHDAS